MLCGCVELHGIAGKVPAVIIRPIFVGDRLVLIRELF